jgi:prepilin-type N-terminal cleavage/methylation domain-containing protein
VRVPDKDCRGFTLIELVASITIMAILAAVTYPHLAATQPFAERGYADGLAAALRESRAVALASGCDVQFTVDTVGYRAFQHAAVGTHCAAAGAWSTPVQRGDGKTLIESQPSGLVLATNRQLVFAADGGVGSAVTINVGLQTVTVDASGTVHGP